MEARQPLSVGFIFEGPTDTATIPVLVAQLLRRPVTVIPLTKQSSGWPDFRRPSPRDLRAGRRHGASWGMFKSYIQALLIAGAEVIVVVADHDNDEDIGQVAPLSHKRWCLLARNLPFDALPADSPALQVIDCSASAAAPGRAQVCHDCHLGPACFPQCISAAYQPEYTPVVIGIAKQMLEAWLLAQPEVIASALWEPLSEEDVVLCETPEAIAHPKNAVVRRYNGGGDLSQNQAETIGQHPAFSAAVIEARCPSFARFAEDIRALVVMP